MAKQYALDGYTVNELIQRVLKGLDYDREQFMYYHLYRNHFNVKEEVTQLQSIGGGKYRDNFGHIWEEQSTLKNYFHMPTPNWIGSSLTFGLIKPYSRKFLRDDNDTGVGGEYEMIIRHDGKRIDALTHQGWQETYNFGRTRYFGPHKKLDVDPHNENPNYMIRVNTGSVKVVE